MIGSIFYFSGTGNTYWAVKKIHELREDFKYYSIEDQQDWEALIEASDIVGFAYPIYASDIPKPMKDFMKARTTTTKMKTMILVTQWAFSGDGSTTSREFLDSKFDISNTLHLKMPNNISVTKLRWIFPYTNDPKKVGKKLDKAAKKLEKFVDEIVQEKRKVVGDYRLAEWAGNLQKKPFRKYYHRFLNDISFDEDHCTNCNLCVRNCPVGNLAKGEKTPVALGQCVLCLRCYNYCPNQSVKYMGAAHMKKRGEPYRVPDKGFMKELGKKNENIDN